jgi:protein SCO1/2
LAQQRGRVVVLFFGYTHCPDICPLTLARLREARSALGADADRARFVFVSADPRRDTPETLRRYMALFGTGITGVTGTEDEMRPVYAAYGIHREIVPRGPGDYLVNHASHLTIVDSAGRWRLTAPHDQKTGELVADLRALLREPSAGAKAR